MARLARKRRILKWAGLVLGCSILAGGIVSIFAKMGVTACLLTSPVTGKPAPFISVSSASAIIGHGEHTETWWFQPIRGPRRPFFWRPQIVRIAFDFPVVYSVLLIPLWVPFVLVALPTTYLFWLDRRRIPPGHCQNCGYNPTGNVSGVCPECGAEARSGQLSGVGHQSDGTKND